ncbi:hypothetical protein BH11MYX3_BH11MYX3_45630 [soil metagenome]
MHRHLIVIGLVLAALAGQSRADACAPTAVLSGDPDLVAAVSEILGGRGIALSPGDCPALRVQLVRRGEALVLELALDDAPPIQRVVAETSTAATVIESFTRADVGSPLLATHAIPSTTADAIRTSPAPVLGGSPSRPSARGVHVFGAFETSYASDRTSWVGAHVGACITLGPVCAAARIRIASVAAGPGVWENQIERRSIEMLAGLDIPFALGRAMLSPGFAAGLGQMHTRGPTHEMRSETGGMRADVHLTLSIPISRHLAIDVFGAADLTQETIVENGPEMATLPAEPRLIMRLGLGIRYGGL